MKIKIFWISYNHFIFGAILIVLFLLLNHNIYQLQIELFLTVMGSIITAILFVNYERFNKKKIFHDIFEYFNQRYDGLNENMNRLIEGKALSCNSDDTNFDKKLLIYDYLNLCAEEYFWYQEGLIKERVWKNWCNGMQFFLRHEEIIYIIKLEKGEPYSSNSYYGFLHSAFIDNLLSDYSKKSKKNIDNSNL